MTRTPSDSRIAFLASAVMGRAVRDALELGNPLCACGVQCSFDAFMREQSHFDADTQDAVRLRLERLGFRF